MLHPVWYTQGMLQWDFSYSHAEIWENVTEVKFCVISKLLF
jgi:hypothetical protein